MFHAPSVEAVGPMRGCRRGRVVFLARRLSRSASIERSFNSAIITTALIDMVIPVAPALGTRCWLMRG